MINHLLVLLTCLLLASCSSSVPPSKNVYSIARDRSWYPMDMEGKENYVFAFSDDLVNHIAKNEALSIDLRGSSWDNLLLGLKKGDYDAILSSFEPIAQLKDEFLFSDTYLHLGLVLVVPVSAQVTSIEQMSGKILAIPAGQDGIFFSNRYPEIVTRTYTLTPKALEDIIYQNVDGAMVPAIIAYSYCRDLYQGYLEVATPPMGNLGLRLIAVKSQQELVDKFNQGLAELQQNGDYQALLKKWKIN